MNGKPGFWVARTILRATASMLGAFAFAARFGALFFVGFARFTFFLLAPFARFFAMALLPLWCARTLHPRVLTMRAASRLA
jgi:hypothetical protein